MTLFSNDGTDNNASYPTPTELVTNATYNIEAEQEYNTNKTGGHSRLYLVEQPLTWPGPWTAGSPNALAFNPLPLITNNSAIILLNATYQAPTDYLVAGLDPTIVAGYTVQKESLASRLGRTTTAAYEIINNNAGSLTVAVMHPFSRGTCYIQSADPFEPPAIDPRWLTNPVDRQVLVEAMFFNRQILATPPMAELQAAQFVPPINADEAAINQVIDTGIRTVYHPSGTLAMLPLEQGGVVDSHLRVWGTQNLRVVDAGIFPMIPAAHLQAVVYGVAEKVCTASGGTWDMADAMLKAADIIKADNLPASGIPTSSSTTLSASAHPSVHANAIVSSQPHILADTTASLPWGSHSIPGPNSARSLSSNTTDSAINPSPLVPFLAAVIGPSLYPITSTNRIPSPSQSDLLVSISIIPALRTTTGPALSSSSPIPSNTTNILSTDLGSALIDTPLSAFTEDSATLYSPIEATTVAPPSSNLLGFEQQSASEVAVLTSMIGSQEASNDQKTAAIDAFMQWLLSFLT